MQAQNLQSREESAVTSNAPPVGASLVPQYPPEANAMLDVEG